MYGSLATRLRVLRAERGLTIRQVAEKSGVDKVTISRIERGERHPYDTTLAKLARAYGVPVEELLEEPAIAGKAEAPALPGQPPTGERRPSRRGPEKSLLLRVELKAVYGMLQPPGMSRERAGAVLELLLPAREAGALDASAYSDPNDQLAAEMLGSVVGAIEAAMASAPLDTDTMIAVETDVLIGEIADYLREQTPLGTEEKR
jgi:transcriptional regulator with XRE-family HTH domain